MPYLTTASPLVEAACLESTEARDLAARLSGGRAPAGDELREAVRDGAQRDMAETVQLCRTNAQDDQAKQADGGRKGDGTGWEGGMRLEWM